VEEMTQVREAEEALDRQGEVYYVILRYISLLRDMYDRMAGKSPTTFEYALLGLTGVSPAAGYDIHRAFATTPLGHFSSSPGAIYPALRRLARRGLLESRLDVTTEARPRRMYSLTKAGRDVLDAWLHEPVTREDFIRGRGAPVLRFAFAEWRLSRDEILAYLRGYRDVVGAYVEELRGHLRDMPAEAGVHARLALELGIRACEAELEWTKWAESQIEPRARGKS
jgi:DNA-binding PadR family transcriptional regulator